MITSYYSSSAPNTFSVEVARLLLVALRNLLPVVSAFLTQFAQLNAYHRVSSRADAGKS
jgi:hypothetical protein